MKVFIALLIATGLIQKPSIEMYWSLDCVIATEFFNSHMSLKRFQLILANFHVDDDNENDGTDSLLKLRPFITHLRQKFLDANTTRLHRVLTRQLVPLKAGCDSRSTIQRNLRNTE